MSQSTIALSIQHVDVEYSGSEPRKLALDDVSLQIHKGSWTTIVGENGSGKSTLAKLMAGLIVPRSGLRMASEDIRVHIVLQNPDTQLLGETVYEEMELSLQDAHPKLDDKAAIQAILDEAGLTLPLDAMIANLSGGEKQLLNIAACMAAEANVYILDEVTSMLDYASRDLVIQIMRRLYDRGATIVWLTHRSEELGLAERVIVLREGQLSYDGPTRHFLYGSVVEEVIPCEHWGMKLPYVVQVVKQLKKRGYSMSVQPLLPSELGHAIIMR